MFQIVYTIGRSGLFESLDEAKAQATHDQETGYRDVESVVDENDAVFVTAEDIAALIGGD